MLIYRLKTTAFILCLGWGGSVIRPFQVIHNQLDGRLVQCKGLDVMLIEPYSALHHSIGGGPSRVALSNVQGIMYCLESNPGLGACYRQVPQPLWDLLALKITDF